MEIETSNLLWNVQPSNLNDTNHSMIRALAFRETAGTRLVFARIRNLERDDVHAIVLPAAYNDDSSKEILIGFSYIEYRESRIAWDIMGPGSFRSHGCGNGTPWACSTVPDVSQQEISPPVILP